MNLFNKKYISPVVDSVDGELKAVDVSLTAKGDNELSAYLDSEKSSFKNNFSYPLITNSISGVVGAVIGSFITYLLMKKLINKQPINPPQIPLIIPCKIVDFI